MEVGGEKGEGQHEERARVSEGSEEGEARPPAITYGSPLTPTHCAAAELRLLRRTSYQHESAGAPSTR